MGKLIRFKRPIFIAIDNKVCSFDGTSSIIRMITSSKEVARRFCKLVNANKDIIK